MAFPTGAEILAFVGVTSPSAPEIAWSDACAAAVAAGIRTRLNAAALVEPYPPDMQAELDVASRIAGAEAYKRREATWGLTGYADLEGNAIRVAKDYLTGVQPLIDRYGNGPGIG